ncbi:hypothetical protein OIU77_006993 [Salix suchowensis]|uniref:Co-chaperone protein p23 n=1 Tax=Salix suchowensis TaxID=1278906 RepID=A0ABQ9AQ61_9ROSI|nr:hypothetical protein OIU77_006993 [Salix suchowensis]
MSRHPEVLWAQKSDKAKSFDFSMELFGNIVPEKKNVNDGFFLKLLVLVLEEGSKTKAGLRNIMCSIQKEEKVWWKRLLKSEEKPAPYIKVDWNKWCDEDDEESACIVLSSHVKWECTLVSLEKNSDTSDDNNAGYEKDDGSSEDEGMLYLPDLEKARGT